MNHRSNSFLLAAAMLAIAGAVRAELPNWINYQGRLATAGGAPLADNSYVAIFKLFDAPTGGTMLWTDTMPVAVRGGIFSASLGKSTTNPFPTTLFAQRLWLETTVDGKTLIPRQELAASPFALVANQALGVPANSITAAQLANDAASITKVSNGLFNQSGTRVGINRAASPQATLAVAGNIFVGVDDRIGHQVVDDPQYYISWVGGDSMSPGAPAGHLKAFGGWRIFTGGATALTIDGGRNSVFYGSVRADSFTTPSSRRLKEHIFGIKNSLEKVLSLKGVTYNRLGEPKSEIGFIAEDVEKVVPEVVVRQGGKVQAMDYSRLTALLVEAIKDQEKDHRAETAKLQSRLQSLEARLARLEKGSK